MRTDTAGQGGPGTGTPPPGPCMPPGPGTPPLPGQGMPPADRAPAVLCVRPVAPGGDGLSGLLALLAEFTPVVEALPPDGALADLGGALGYFGRDAVDLAAVLRVRALALYGVDCTIGVGPGPMAARAAARAAAPGTTLAVPGGPDAVAAFLADRPVTAVPGVGSATARALGSYGLHTVGSVAAAPLPAVQRLIGARAGRELHEKARGVDRTRVVPNAAARSVAGEHAFDHDELDASAHRRALLSLTADLGARLRAEGQVCRALTLTVRCADRTGRPLTRSRTLPEPTAHTPALTTTAYRMYEALGLQRARVRALALRAEGLGPAERAARQLSLDPADARAHRLEQAADRARARFGPSAVIPGTLAA